MISLDELPFQKLGDFHLCVTAPLVIKMSGTKRTMLISIPGDAIKRDPERENCAVLTIAAQTANSIHIRVTFNVVTRYVIYGLMAPMESMKHIFN